jgi:type II secretory pathway component PulF
VIVNEACFSLQSSKRKGRVVKGVDIAVDEEDVERCLAGSGLSLIHGKAVRQSPLAGLLQGVIKPRAVVEFYHRLAQTLEIGLPVMRWATATWKRS